MKLAAAATVRVTLRDGGKAAASGQVVGVLVTEPSRRGDQEPAERLIRRVPGE